MDKVIAEAKHLTPDLGGRASTTEMGDAVAAAVLMKRPGYGVADTASQIRRRRHSAAMTHYLRRFI